MFFYSFLNFILTAEDDSIPASPRGSCRAQYCVLPDLIQNTISPVYFFTFFFFLNCDQDCTISFIVLNATCFYLTHMDFLLGRILFSITKDVAERSIPSDVSQMGF